MRRILKNNKWDTCSRKQKILSPENVQDDVFEKILIEYIAEFNSDLRNKFYVFWSWFLTLFEQIGFLKWTNCVLVIFVILEGYYRGGTEIRLIFVNLRKLT